MYTQILTLTAVVIWTCERQSYTFQIKNAEESQGAQWNGWNRRMPQGFTALAFNTSLGGTERSMRRERSSWSWTHEATAVRQPTSWTGCTRRGTRRAQDRTQDKIETESRSIRTATCKHLPFATKFSVLYTAISAPTTRFFTDCLLLLLLSSTQRHFGWESGSLLLVVRVNNAQQWTHTHSVLESTKQQCAVVRCWYGVDIPLLSCYKAISLSKMTPDIQFSFTDSH